MKGPKDEKFPAPLCQEPLALAGLCFIIILVLAAIFAPWITSYGWKERTPDLRQGPSWEHWFGTDTLGYDVYTRSSTAPVLAEDRCRVDADRTVDRRRFGAVSGFFGGRTDSLLMRIVDIFLSIPYFILAVAIATVFGRGENAIIIVLGVTGWLAIARIVRASFLGLKKMEYTEAAQALGFGRTRMIFGHLLPNATVPIIVYGTIAIGGAILAEAALSFIGVGRSSPRRHGG